MSPTTDAIFAEDLALINEAAISEIEVVATADCRNVDTNTQPVNGPA